MKDIKKDKLKKMSREMLIKLIYAYDDYIQNANDDDRYADGFKPVCVAEYIDCEFFEMFVEGVENEKSKNS